MQNKKLIVLIILGIAAVFSLIYGITASPKGKDARAAKPVITHEAETIQPVKKLFLKERHAVKTKFKSWGRNPFIQGKIQEIIQEKPPVPESLKLTLKGIMWNAQNPKALINNAILSKGDKIGINTMVDIKQKSVILNDGAKDFEIRLH
jgi:hypothetical protein